MSRIGKKPVVIPAGVTVDVKENMLKVKGSKGELTLVVHPKVQLEQKDSELLVNVKNPNNKQERALWGLYRALQLPA
jgi:large subunit ribosomal protein L6